MTGPTPLSLDRVKCYSLKNRISKANLQDFGKAWKPGGDLKQWFRSLPKILAGKHLREVVDRIVCAVSSGRPFILAMGAHPIKVGLSPVIVDLIERGILTAVAMNGACVIHDAEVAMVGNTSEDVEAGIREGTFGMASETGKVLNEALVDGAKKGLGFGQSVGARLLNEGFPYNEFSILARARELGIPVTVHVAIGTDVIHFHPGADGAALGKTSHLDFRLFAGLVANLEGGVFLNLGSAVIMPEVFLKALTLVRNLGHRVRDFTTVNMDFVAHYRPLTNVVHRPTLDGGKGYNLVGQHEIMFPLLAALITETMMNSNGER